MAATPNYYNPPDPTNNIDAQQAGNSLVPGRDTSDALNAYLSRQPGETDDELHARIAAQKANQPPPDYSHDKPILHAQGQAAGSDNSGVGTGPAAAPAGSPNSPMVTANGGVPPGVPYNPAPPAPPPPVAVSTQPVAARATLPSTDANPNPNNFPQDFPPPAGAQLQDTSGNPAGASAPGQNNQQVIDAFWSEITQQGRASLTPQELQNIIAKNPGVHMVPGSQDKVQLPNGQIVDVIQDSGGLNKPSWSITGGAPGENGQPMTAGGGAAGAGGWTPPPVHAPTPATIIPHPTVQPTANTAQAGLGAGESNPLAADYHQQGSIGAGTAATPATEMPVYKPSDITQYTAPDMTGDNTTLDHLLGQIGSAQSPTYDPSNITQFQGADDSAQQNGLNSLIQQIIGGSAPTYAGANITQFNQSSNPQINALQDQQMKEILSNPTYSQDYKNKLMESQKELIANRGQADNLALKQNAARRGVTDSGATGAAERRLNTGVTNDLLKSNREIDINTTGANRQSLLDALSASQGLLASRAGVESQGYASKLAGESAQANEGSKVYQSKLDAANLKNSSATTVGNILSQRSASEIGKYGAKLQGETAQAAEKGKAYQSLVDAITQKNSTAANYANIMGAKGDIANKAYTTGLAGQEAQAAEKARAYQSQADAAKVREQARQANQNFTEQSRQFNTSSGLARDQFNENTRQFDQNFIEQVRQFDAQLAQQMTQFNATNQLGWANNQQGYDIANLNSQNSLINNIMGNG